MEIKRLKINGLYKYFSNVFGWDFLPIKPSKKGIDKVYDIEGDDIAIYIKTVCRLFFYVII